MGNGLIAFLLALGAGAWIYDKLTRRTGGMAKEAAIAAGVVGVVVFVIILFVLSFL